MHGMVMVQIKVIYMRHNMRIEVEEAIESTNLIPSENYRGRL